MADLFWLRVIQDLDFAESKNVSTGWVFHQLDVVTTLDPRYRIVYSAGATVLSVLVRDSVGAGILYDRAIQNYPNNWRILYRAASHFLLELQDCGKAADLYRRAQINGAPPWLNGLAAQLYTATGQTALAKTILLDALEKFRGTEVEEHLKERLKGVESGQVSKIECKK